MLTGGRLLGLQVLYEYSSTSAENNHEGYKDQVITSPVPVRVTVCSTTEQYDMGSFV